MKRIASASGILALGLIAALAQTSSAADNTSATVNLGGAWKLNPELSENPAQKMMEAMRNMGGPGGQGGGRGGGGGIGGGGGMGGGGGRGGDEMGGGGGGGRGGGGAQGGGRGQGGPGAGLALDEPPFDGGPDAEPERGQGQDESGRRAQGQQGAGQEGGRGRGRMAGLIPSPQFQIEQEGDNLAFRSDRNLRLLHSDGQKRQKEGAGGKREVTTKFDKGTLVVETKGEQGGKRKETYKLREDQKLQIEVAIEGSGRMPSLKFKLVYDAVAPTQF